MNGVHIVEQRGTIAAAAIIISERLKPASPVTDPAQIVSAPDSVPAGSIEMVSTAR